MSVTDENPSMDDEIKYCTWKYSHKGGFCWAGAYASGDYLVFASDDGSADGNYTNTSILYSVSTSTCVMLDKLTGLKGDICTSVAYNNGYVYFATKGGCLYRVKMNQNGTFGQVLGYDLGGMANATPVIYKGRIYIGVCGQGGQDGEKNGNSTDQKKTGSKGKEKDTGKSEDKKKTDEKSNGTSSWKKAETADGSSSSDTGSDGDSLENAGKPEGQTVTVQLADGWKGMGNFPKLLIILAVLIAGYLSFWYRARKYYKKKLLTKSRRKPYAATKRYR